MSRRTAIGVVAALAAAGATAQSPTQPTPTPAPAPVAAPAPTELTLEQLLGPRGFSAVQLRENVFGQLETEAVLDAEHRLRVGVSTSFSKTIFDRAAVEKLGLPIVPTNVELTGGGKKQRLGSVKLESFALDETSLGPTTIYTADLSAFTSQSSAEPVQGMIGSDFLTKYQAVLEVSAAKLYLRVR